jgi:3-oxoacyl-[acyl-carrier-protein] synthase II
MRQRVVVTGIGCISCFGIGHRSFADAITAGGSGIRPISAFDTSQCRSHCAATIDGFDPAVFIAPLKLRRIDAVGRLALACARLLIDDAALAIGSGGTDDVGVSLGTYTAGLDSTVEYLQGLTSYGPSGVPALLFSNTVSNAPASLCAIEHGLRGPNVTFNQREASSLAALAYAAGIIADDRVAAMLSGGTDRLEETFFKVHDRFRALSPMRGREEVARPFDRRRNGFVLGEAGVMLLLERADTAAGRDARPYGEILGIGMTASATRQNAWPADPSGIARAVRLALADAETAPGEIDMVVAAANGSRLDRIEAEAICAVFGERAVPVVSLKGAIGESGAAGSAGVVAGLLTLAAGAIPPTAGFAEADPSAAVNVSSEVRPARGGTFVVNAVASGGTNCALVVRAAPRVTYRHSVASRLHDV